MQLQNQIQCWDDHSGHFVTVFLESFIPSLVQRDSSSGSISCCTTWLHSLENECCKSVLGHDGTKSVAIVDIYEKILDDDGCCTWTSMLVSFHLDKDDSTGYFGRCGTTFLKMGECKGQDLKGFTLTDLLDISGESSTSYGDQTGVRELLDFYWDTW